MYSRRRKLRKCPFACVRTQVVGWWIASRQPGNSFSQSSPQASPGVAPYGRQTALALLEERKARRWCSSCAVSTGGLLEFSCAADQDISHHKTRNTTERFVN